MSSVFIDLCSPENPNDVYTLEFEVLDTVIAKRWLDLLQLAQKLNYTIDDINRFYGFDLPEVEKAKALALINNCIDQINSHKKIIDRKLDTVDDQDTLNYLHHIFEEYHGLLDQQNTEFWNSCPKYVQHALAMLNIYVHRCESAVKSKRRFTVTYYSLPKVCKLEESDYDLFTPYRTFGTMYLNYVEIGKTLTDFWHDDDKYIHEDAFKPFDYFSADFAVTFTDDNKADKDRIVKEVWQYYKQNENFFKSKGYEYLDKRLTPAAILPVANLVYYNKQEIIDNIACRQQIKAVRVIL